MMTVNHTVLLVLLRIQKHVCSTQHDVSLPTVFNLSAGGKYELSELVHGTISLWNSFLDITSGFVNFVVV